MRSSASRRDRIALAVPSITHRAKHPYKERKDEILSTLRRMVTDHSLMDGEGETFARDASCDKYQLESPRSQNAWMRSVPRLLLGSTGDVSLRWK